MSVSLVLKARPREHVTISRNGEKWKNLETTEIPFHIEREEKNEGNSLDILYSLDD